MTDSERQSKQVQYRYRPNVLMKAATTTSATVASSNGFQSTPALSDYATTQAIAQRSRPTMESYAAREDNSNMLWASFDQALSQTHQFPEVFPRYTTCMEQSYDPTSVSWWTSTNSSVASDPCSGGAWSSPSSSMCFSPEPAYQLPYMDNDQWSRHDLDPYFVQEVAAPQTMESLYGNTSLYMPDMSQQAQFQYAFDPILPAFESVELESKPESLNSVSDHTEAAVLKRSDSCISGSRTSSPPSIPPLNATSVTSPPPQPKSSQFQGQLLDFSPPIAQTKTKGPKFAALPCPLAAYGCTSSFISKNEWKRHINTQHLRLEAWLCDECPKRDIKREFNRKDLFIQHLKRMHPAPCDAHAPKAQPVKAKTTKSAATKNERSGKGSKADDTDPALLEAEQRCHIVLRQPPSESVCLFCSTNFSGRGSWEARIEHIAKHMEQYKKSGRDVPSPKTWRADRALEQWLVSESVIAKVRQRWSVA